MHQATSIKIEGTAPKLFLLQGTVLCKPVKNKMADIHIIQSEATRQRVIVIVLNTFLFKDYHTS